MKKLIKWLKGLGRTTPANNEKVQRLLVWAAQDEQKMEAYSEAAMLAKTNSSYERRLYKAACYHGLVALAYRRQANDLLAAEGGAA